LRLSIVKNLVKLSHGEYLALESIESKLKNSPYVENICVYANSEQPFCIAIVHPNKGRVEELASKVGASDSFEKLCENDKVRKEVLKDIVDAGRKANLKSFELPKDVLLTPEEWTPQNYLTAAMKLKRQEVQKVFKKEIDECYKKNSE